MKTIAAFSMTLALAAMSFAQTATPAAPAAKETAAPTSVKKHSKKKVHVKKTTASSTAVPPAGK